jgi:hypothetical protein
MVNRRSAPKHAGVDVLTGRWFALNNAAEVILPGSSNKPGLYLAVEGNLGHKGTNLDFGNAGAGYASTVSFIYPSVQQSNECALAYGVFRYEVGPEGCDPADAGLVTDALVTVDQYGRIITAGSGDVAMGKVEAVTRDANGVTKLVVRTFGG